MRLYQCQTESCINHGAQREIVDDAQPDAFICIACSHPYATLDDQPLPNQDAVTELAAEMQAQLKEE